MVRLPLFMHCNIDAKGRAVRLIIGAVAAMLGSGFALAWLFSDGLLRWPLYAGLGLLAAGIVGILEGWAGWCVVRAMGFRTRI